MTVSDSPGMDVRPGAARLAVSTLFFVNGAIVASWVPHIPIVKQRLGIGDGHLGAVLLFMAVGALELKFWEACCAVLGRPDLKSRHWSCDQLIGGADAMAVKAVLDGIFAQQSQAFWSATRNVSSMRRSRLPTACRHCRSPGWTYGWSNGPTRMPS